MTKLDRGLLTLLGLGVWVLIAITLASTTVEGGAAQVSRRDIQRIIERCDVEGEVYMYSEKYGEIEGGSISC